MHSRCFGWAALLLALSACHSKDAPAPAASVALAEVPAPASLVAELSLGNPKETWRRLKLLGGPAADALPSSLPVLMTTSLSLPPSAAQSLDETVPLVGAVLSHADAAEPDVVLGAHVVSGAELIASLTLGDGAKFRHAEVAPRVSRLLPAPGAPDFDGALGVSGNYLLVATSVAALTEAGRFVAQTLPRHARTEPGLLLRANQSVLAGALSQRLRRGWQTRRAGLAARDRVERDAKGRAPDFADPEVLLSGVDNTIESWLAVLESSRELSLSLDPETDRLRAELTLTPAAEGPAALLSRELVVGPVAPLFQLPASTRAALLLRGDAEPRASSDGGLGESIAKLFGERLNVEQAKRLVKAFDDLSRSRRGATALGLVQTPAPALLLTCELADAEAFSRALADVLSLVQLPPIASWITALAGKPTLALSRAAQPPHALLRFQAKVGAKAPTYGPSALNVTWQTRDGVGYVVVSPDAALGLAPFAEPTRLEAQAWLQSRPVELAQHVALGFFADARLVAPGGPDEAPVLLSFGKKADSIAVSVDVSSRALPAFARVFALDR